MVAEKHFTAVSGSSFLPTDNSSVKEIDTNSVYLVDFTKLNSVNDLVLILSGLGIGFPGNHPLIQNLKPFLNLDNPIPQEGLQKAQQPRPEPKDLELPKIKKV
jgi:hypothetical protein